MHADVAIGARRKEPGHFGRVVLPDLHRQHSARREMCRGCFDESSNKEKTVGTSVKRTEGIVPDLALQTRKLCRGNVWQVGDNPVEAFPVSRKEIRFVKSDPFTHRVPRGVFLCETQRFGRKVCRGYAGRGSCKAKVIAMTPEPVPTSRRLSLASWLREYSTISSTSCSVSGRGTRARPSLRNDRPEKLSRAEQVLKRFAGAAIANQIPERCSFGIGKGTVKLEIKIQASLAKNMRKQMLRVEPRTFHPVVLEITGSGG